MELVSKVRDAEHWVQVLESSEKKLVVVDVHKDWQNLDSVVLKLSRRLLQLNVGLHVDGIEDTGSCKPRFLFFKDRKQIADVDGANAPLLEQLVKQHLPPLGNDDEEN
ncbi:hypothetical protein PC116_g25581 [Phytophthora cactorum]|uniref:Thioredoxin-like fold n=1 Tax=Phytophthora cactorum TaxID=29920 RepID=A0A8T1JNQ5_9STRA|nr:hypothetical protein PC113_g21369 [Phytophthora cactorum]KAG2962838.1 hypothetical protein PC118_g21214 [Phytophthora cactorum]KAG2972218.1 hypothetical protein PC119_g23229 [Phytophthora cactorum]KAG4226003.1 hypothetical protein PC116_g25581 [Phytophthora cactorum]